MIIAFATIGDTRDIRRGSGTPFYLWQALIKAGVEVLLVGPLDIKLPWLTRFFKYLSLKTGKKYFSYRDPFSGKALGRKVAELLSGMEYDVLLTNDFCIAGYCKMNKPIILYTDDHFPVNFSENVHPSFKNLSKTAIHFSQMTTRRGLSNADRCIFASQFALDCASSYKLANAKSYILNPYGANIDFPTAPPRRSIQTIIQKGWIDLLFVGKDWKRKGGDVAVAVARQLTAKGFPARLHVVGVDLSDTIKDEFILFHGLLNKDVAVEKDELLRLYQECDILLVPSKAEGFGLVFVEASAFGMPSLAYDNTGVRTAVTNGVNGILLDNLSTADDFAEVILNWIKEPDTYAQICQSARLLFEEKFTWSVSVNNLLKIVE